MPKTLRQIKLDAVHDALSRHAWSRKPAARDLAISDRALSDYIRALRRDGFHILAAPATKLTHAVPCPCTATACKRARREHAALERRKSLGLIRYCARCARPRTDRELFPNNGCRRCFQD